MEQGELAPPHSAVLGSYYFRLPLLILMRKAFKPYCQA